MSTLEGDLEGDSITNYKFKVFNSEIIDAHIEEASAFYDEYGLRDKTPQEIVDMHDEKIDWVCTVLMYASILHDAETFAGVMGVWTHPTGWSLADYCDYYWCRSSTFHADSGTRECVFELWRRGERNGPKAVCSIHHEIDNPDWKYWE